MVTRRLGRQLARDCTSYSTREQREKRAERREKRVRVRRREQVYPVAGCLLVRRSPFGERYSIIN